MDRDIELPEINQVATGLVDRYGVNRYNTKVKLKWGKGGSSRPQLDPWLTQIAMHATMPLFKQVSHHFPRSID